MTVLNVQGNRKDMLTQPLMIIGKAEVLNVSQNVLETFDMRRDITTTKLMYVKHSFTSISIIHNLIVVVMSHKVVSS